MRFYVANAIGIAAVIFFVLSYQQKNTAADRGVQCDFTCAVCAAIYLVGGV